MGRYLDASFVFDGFLLDDGTFTTVDPPGSTFTEAIGINARARSSATTWTPAAHSMASWQHRSNCSPQPSSSLNCCLLYPAKKHTRKLSQRKNKTMKTRTTSSSLIALLLACFGFFPTAHGVVPAPDGGYAGKNTAEGANALLSLNVNTGSDNTAVGWSSLKSNVQGDFNTAIGSGALFNNTAHRNTAIGGAAMFSNTAGSFNTAVGMLSLFTNSYRQQQHGHGRWCAF